MTGARVLTCERCRGLLDRLRQAYAAASIQIEDLALWYDLADVRWVAELRGPVLDMWGAAGADRDRATRAAHHATLLDRTAKALEVSSTLPGYKPVARHLKNFRLLPSRGQAAQQASDHLYELEVAARLSMIMSDIHLDEPDIRIADPDTGVSFSIACKRPQAVENVRSAVRAGVDQIRRLGTAGTVFVCVDRLIDPLVRDHSGNSLAPECDRRLEVVVRGCREDVEAELHRYPPALRDAGQPPLGALGVVLSGSFFLFGRDGPGGDMFINTVPLTRRIPASDMGWVTTLLIVLQKSHARGEQTLRDRD